ncbi:sulfotransferase 1A1-like isoform X2 [Dreissena polymorpha]|uniref:sulfotransferase 1A1-like isoform X2 n=1 Tax=Dreissena polymorpha TaxID=45954 RepID=UPI0022656253|nr:sulfotransferase 1A1-like isoform X2 [Dreissena polymorpha]XP_052218486.1 sulfotransferase 1A1-like isoform X2 [Dreissena polymorpha]XP_052218497.1 sulfotransferase 1A1-like isoform X2 [Dreissena polymorpha]
MPIKNIDDGSGETLRVLEVDGYFAPTFDTNQQEEEFRSIPNWPLKPDDVLICAYPKAGTHWLWEVSSMLVNQSADRVKLIKETAMLEALTEEQFRNIPSPRVLNTHIPLRLMPKDTLSNKTKIVFVQRNPKDICVSFFNHHSKIVEYDFNGKFENYVNRFLKGLVDYGSWFEYTLEWEKIIRDNPEHPFHMMSYEDMKSDPISEIGRLSEFLGLKSSPELIAEIADKCDFSAMKKEKDPLENTKDWKDAKPGMYRKGQVGDWKNWFTVAQSEYFDTVFNQRMKDSSFTYRFS